MGRTKQKPRIVALLVIAGLFVIGVCGGLVYTEVYLPQHIRSMIEDGSACFVPTGNTHYNDNGKKVSTTSYSYTSGALTGMRTNYVNGNSEHSIDYSITESGLPAEWSSSDTSWGNGEVVVEQRNSKGAPTDFVETQVGDDSQRDVSWHLEYDEHGNIETASKKSSYTVMPDTNEAMARIPDGQSYDEDVLYKFDTSGYLTAYNNMVTTSIEAYQITKVPGYSNEETGEYGYVRFGPPSKQSFVSLETRRLSYGKDTEGDKGSCTCKHFESTTGKKGETQNVDYTFSYDDFGNIIEVHKEGVLVEEYEYSLLEHPTLWLRIQSHLKAPYPEALSLKSGLFSSVFV